MDREFIEKNQIVERYLTGKLPFKGVQDFERYCHDHPELLDEIKLSERLHAGMRLLEAGGHGTGVYRQVKPAWWRRIEFTAGLAVLAIVLAISLSVLSNQYLSAQADCGPENGSRRGSAAPTLAHDQ
jgi:hypothetical protein